MSFEVLPDCIGCGACEFACPTGAIAQGTDFRVAYLVDPLLCNDCGECVPVCPVDALVPDPAWAVCMERGCPLSSRRYTAWSCSQGAERCPECDQMMWRRPDGDTWKCPACDLGSKVACPKIRHAHAATQ